MLRAAISLVGHTAGAVGELCDALDRLPAAEESAGAAEARSLLDLRATV